MKKKISFFCIPTALLFFIYNTLYPSIPNLKVSTENNRNNFTAITNGGTWFDSSNGQGGNSFDLGDHDFNRLKEVSPRDFSCNSLVKVKPTFTKGLDEFKVYSFEGDSEENQNLTEIPIENYKFTTPKEPGTYSYVVTADWFGDNTHHIRFVFKLNCT